ncbi:MAG TPA: MBOAT family O-acyltransferase [Planctomycetota bacterium]|nr:MBOAT family O-acyltransferase [Planctomycetota bacterium]
MRFNSLEFLVFAALFFLIWRYVKRNQSARWLWIMLMSSVFYGWWEWSYLWLLFVSGGIDFVSAWWIESFPRHRKKLLFFSMASNLGILGFYKYSAFAAENLNVLLQPLSLQVPIVNYALPIGISFYTFQSMSYTIDVYRGECKATRNILHFFAGLMLFPQLVAGPILRARDILPQLEPEPVPPDEQKRFEGLALIAHGYFKKVVIADNLAPTVTAAFGAHGLGVIESSAYWWAIMAMFAFQIYCDFSGYTDIARGLAKWMGYDFALNFNHPYSAASIRDFWSRWHISLSTWFRDYVYVPMGGSRTSPLRTHVNLWITMILSGLWHGASWRFIIWGALHAAYVSLERVTDWPRRILSLPLGRFIAIAVVLVQVLVAWVFFRAESMAQATGIIRVMFSFVSAPHDSLQPALAFLLLGIGYETWMCVRVQPFMLRTKGWMEPAGVACLLVAAVFFRGHGQNFIYFQF